jgi:hypothetical protein
VSENVLDMIDNVVSQYGDAMRWSPDTEPTVDPDARYLAWSIQDEERRRQIRAAAQPRTWPSGIPFDRARLVPYHYLTEPEQSALHAWVADHGLNPRDVPVDGILGYDEATGEWRIRVHRRRDGKVHLGPDGEVESYVVRRRALAPLPWPVIAE